MAEAHEADSLTFRTDIVLPEAIYDKKLYQKLEIFPSHGTLFTFTLLSCFLNQYRDFIKLNAKAHRFKGSEESFKFVHSTEKQYFIKIKIGEKIRVFLSTCMLVAQWSKCSYEAFTTLGRFNKTLKKPHLRTVLYFYLSFTDLLATSKYLLLHSPIMFCAKTEFSECFRFFASRCQNLPDNDDTSLIHDYREFFKFPKNFVISSLEELTKHVSGYLILNLEPVQMRKHLKTLKKDGITYYILSGVYISSYANSVLHENDIINGFLLDTTWRVMPRYVTSIIMGSLYNTGIGLGFSFGRGEDKQIYTELLQKLSTHLNYEFTQKILESDQGTALKAACDDFKMVHLACLRHLLVSLKFSEFSYGIGILLRAVSKKD